MYKYASESSGIFVIFFIELRCMLKTVVPVV